MITMAQRIEELRTEKGLSRPALSAALGFPKTAAEKFETGRATPTKEQQEKIETIIRYYPADKQLGVAQEECAELIQAISKVLRHWNSTRLDRLDHLAEEIADVRIMCAQMVRIFGLAGKVHQYIDRKLDERLEKIREEEQAHADKN